MKASEKKTLMLLGTTIAGALAGRWMAPKVGATFGLTFGPWGVAAGAVIGAVVGAAVGSTLAGEGEFPQLDDVQDPLGLQSGL